MSMPAVRVVVVRLSPFALNLLAEMTLFMGALFMYFSKNLGLSFCVKILGLALKV